MRSIVFACMCALPIYLHALLPPLWHSISEIEGLLHDSQISRFIDSAHTIRLIERVEGGYRVRTNSAELFVAVQTKSNGAGPSKFEYHFKVVKRF